MSELKQWLERHGLGEFAEPFAKERIELGDLVNLSENDLRELGLLMGPRKRFLEAVQRELASSHDPTEPATALPPISPLRYTPGSQGFRRGRT
jgi:hypothetical protein